MSQGTAEKTFIAGSTIVAGWLFEDVTLYEMTLLDEPETESPEELEKIIAAVVDELTQSSPKLCCRQEEVT